MNYELFAFVNGWAGRYSGLDAVTIWDPDHCCADQLHSAGLRPVLWTDWGRDWTSDATGESVYRTAVRNLRGGATLLLHDSDATSAPGSWRATLAALLQLIESALTRRLTLATLSTHGIDQGHPEPSGGVSVRHRGRIPGPLRRTA
ncbi:hypothetical protein [Catellatospora tritici]|uniref:hypothetical protein n=1 Tax=Catellatospora tritici TaxID=2851566 RepID=UPI001C2D2EB2|nr:hypothetical protein [Catellatospora tritici]MBV1854436.1 hypothetical protein [Catellatospora tritici]